MVHRQQMNLYVSPCPPLCFFMEAVPFAPPLLYSLASHLSVCVKVWSSSVFIKSRDISIYAMVIRFCQEQGNHPSQFKKKVTGAKERMVHQLQTNIRFFCCTRNPGWTTASLTLYSNTVSMYIVLGLHITRSQRTHTRCAVSSILDVAYM